MCAWTRGRRGPPELTGNAAGGGSVDLGHLDVAADHARTLLRTVETEIIPRLMLLHRQDAPITRPALPAELLELPHDEEQVAAFTEQLLIGQEQALAFVRMRAEAGMPVPLICLNLLAPAARLLGEMWNQDRCDFAQVTIALSRLHAILRLLATGLPAYSDGAEGGRSAAFAPAPGEQHTLGLTMVRDFFRASGWDVSDGCSEQPDDVVALVRERRFDLVGFSIGSERHTDALRTLIGSVRKASTNRRVLVLIGGPLLLERPQLAKSLGADASADDARQAILAAEGLLAARCELR